MSAAAGASSGSAAAGHGTLPRVVVAVTVDNLAVVTSKLYEAGFTDVSVWSVDEFVDATAAQVPAGRHHERSVGAVRLALRRTLG
jgi:hypothetical protein